MTIQSFITTQLFHIEPEVAIILASLSVLICLVSIFWIYSYASYANRYWEIADRCEKNVEGLDGFTDKDVFIDILESTKPEGLCGFLDQSIMRRLLKMTYKPEKGLLPPFKMLLIVAIIMIIASIGVCILSIRV